MAASYHVRTVFTSGRFRRSFPSFAAMNLSSTSLRMIALRPIRSTGIFSHSTSFRMVFLPMPVYSDASSIVIPILTSAIEISSLFSDNLFFLHFHSCSYPYPPFLLFYNIALCNTVKYMINNYDGFVKSFCGYFYFAYCNICFCVLL